MAASRHDSGGLRRDSSTAIYPGAVTPLLSERERQVANLIAQGLLHKQIAFQMGVSEKTVAVHAYNIRRKLGLSGTWKRSLKVHLRGLCQIELIALYDALASAEDQSKNDTTSQLW